MAKTATTQWNWWVELLKIVGFAGVLFACGMVIVTLMKVWWDGTALDSVRSDASSAYNRVNNAESREQYLQSQITALTAAYNKDHPDAKINQTIDVYSSSAGSCCWTSYGSVTCRSVGSC